jgi:hypothetical protein
MLAYKLQTPGNYPEESIQQKIEWLRYSGMDCVEVSRKNDSSIEASNKKIY